MMSSGHNDDEYYDDEGGGRRRPLASSSSSSPPNGNGVGSSGEGAAGAAGGAGDDDGGRHPAIVAAMPPKPPPPPPPMPSGRKHRSMRELWGSKSKSPPRDRTPSAAASASASAASAASSSSSSSPPRGGLGNLGRSLSSLLPRRESFGGGAGGGGSGSGSSRGFVRSPARRAGKSRSPPPPRSPTRGGGGSSPSAPVGAAASANGGVPTGGGGGGGGGRYAPAARDADDGDEPPPPHHEKPPNSHLALHALSHTVAQSADRLAAGADSLASSISASLASAATALATRKYTLPDKTVASQVLMYRQLLHTACRPGLRLSRKFEGTPAQRAVIHMPWWERGIEQSRRMVISYDNLIVRLWLGGAIMPYVEGGFAHKQPAGRSGAEVERAGGDKTEEGSEKTEESTRPASPPDLLSGSPPKSAAAEANRGGSDAAPPPSPPPPTHVDTLIDDKGLPPIPHPFWIARLGFQQSDPVTDFRSGGVLSLAMLVHIVESCPAVHARFLPGGDASMLPFGITCINVTDMLAKFLMFSKSVDRIDALLSQKPFWRMFADPTAILVLQELSMDGLADVVVELGRERKVPSAGGNRTTPDGGKRGGSPTNNANPAHGDGKVTVFDFAEILRRTEDRVLNDLLGAGPKSVEELRAIHSRNRTRYIRTLEKKERANRVREDAKGGIKDAGEKLVQGGEKVGEKVNPLPQVDAIKNALHEVVRKRPTSPKSWKKKGATVAASDGASPSSASGDPGRAAATKSPTGATRPLVSAADDPRIVPPDLLSGDAPQPPPPTAAAKGGEDDEGEWAGGRGATDAGGAGAGATTAGAKKGEEFVIDDDDLL